MIDILPSKEMAVIDWLRSQFMPGLSHIFPDRLVDVYVAWPLNSIKLRAWHLSDASDKPAQSKLAHILAMPLEGIVSSFGMLDVLMHRLVEDGVLRPLTWERRGVLTTRLYDVGA